MRGVHALDLEISVVKQGELSTEIDVCNKGHTGKPGIVEHQWEHQHHVNWKDTRVLDRAARPVQLLVKEILQMTPPNNMLNRVISYLVAGSLP